MTADLAEIKKEDIHEGRWKNARAIGTSNAADSIVFGAPTFMGDTSAVFKMFLEWAFEPCLKQGPKR